MSQTDKIRPGVDANVVEANVVRGHDAILTGNVPEDLQIAASRNDADDVVGIVTIWNRTDSTTEQVLDLRSGLILGTAERAQVFVGATDPTGVLTATAGSLYVSTTPPKLYQNQDGVTDWKVISDDLGGETLEETLVLGNTSGDNPIIISDEPTAGIQGEDKSGGTGGGDLKLRSGNESGLAGSGGNVEVSTGTTVGGNSGSIIGSTAVVTTGGASGSIQWVTGSTSGGGGTGTITIRTGTTDVAATGSLQLGSGDATGSGGTGGLVNMKAGDGPSDGVGGELRVLAGNTFPIVIPVSPQPPGKGGRVLVYGGASSGTEDGGHVVIAGGAGGSGGGDGGNVLLGGGAGGGGGSEGQVYATSIFSAENIKRGTGDPNGSVSGNEGDIYQRTAGGVGELYLNTNGTLNGWIKLGAAGDFFNSLVKTQWGSVHASMATNQINSDGFFDEATFSFAGASVTRVADVGGPNLRWVVGNTDDAGIEIVVGFGAGALQRQQKFIIGFKFSVDSLDTGYISFLGVSNQVLSTMLTNSPTGDWIGLQKLDGTTNFRFATRGNTGIYNAGNVTFALDEVHYFIIDTTVSNAITFLLLDSTLNLVQTATISPVSDNTSPSLTDVLRPICGIKGTDAVLKTFDFYHFTAVVNGDLNLGGGGGGSTPTLETVLTSGDFTGSNNIILTDWDATWGGIIRGEADPPLNIPDGGRVTIAGGATTDLLGTGGHLYLFSGNPAIASANKSGDASLNSGSVLDVTNTGGTGDVIVSSGITSGSGVSGDLWLMTGATTTGTSGTVYLQSNFSVGGNTGNVAIQTGAAGLTAGDISLTGGNSTLGIGGGIQFQGGSGGGPGGQGGDILMIGGIPDPGFNLNGASVGIICTQGAGSGDGGSFAVAVGNGGPGGGDGGGFAFTAGNGVAGVSAGGSIVLNPGTGFGGGADGAVVVNGKLTVTGLIDPTGMVMVNQGTIPGGTPAAGSSTLWVRTSDNSLMLTDDGGSDHPVSGSAIETKDEGGTLTTLTQSLDFVGAGVTASAVGNNVTVTIPGGGGAADLGTVLGNGNQTNAHNIEMTAGDQIVGENNAGGNGGDLSFLTGNSTNTGSRSGHFEFNINTPGTGGAAGDFIFTGQPGGNNTTGNAGTGSDFDVQTGPGGVVTVSGDGGRGGDVTFTLGDGDDGAGGGDGGRGGDTRFAMGAGGAGATAGDGGDFELLAGTGGTGTVISGDGGTVRFVTGTGPGSAAIDAGDAGSFEIFTGNGGTTTNAGSDGGDGGPWNVQLGDGGGAAGAGGGGDGGYLAIITGAGGSTDSGVAGFGGLCSITLGQGADATGGTGGLGGLFDFQAGDGGNEISAGGGGAGGGMTITLGDGGQGVGGGNTGGAAGDFTVTAGDGGVGTGGAAGLIGGLISLTAGDGGTGTPGGSGGTASLIAGAAASGGQDGNVVLATRPPNPGPFFGVGGEIVILTSNAAAGGVGSYIRMLPGSGTTGGSGVLHGGTSATGNGGDATLEAGATTLVGASSGGDAHVIAGDASDPAGSGGNIYLTPGPASGGGLPGVVSFDGGVDPGGPASTPFVGHQRSNAASAGAVPGFPGMIDPTALAGGSYGTSFVVPFNVPFATAPSNIQITLSQFGPPAAPFAGTVAVVHSVTPVGFEIGFDAAGPQPNMAFYWEAWL